MISAECVEQSQFRKLTEVPNRKEIRVIRPVGTEKRHEFRTCYLSTDGDLLYHAPVTDEDYSHDTLHGLYDHAQALAEAVSKPVLLAGRNALPKLSLKDVEELVFGPRS